MRNKKLFQRLMAVVMCSTLLATTPVMTYATTNAVASEEVLDNSNTLPESWFTYQVLVDGTYGIKGLSDEAGDCSELKLPTMYNGIAVTSIQRGAFEANKDIKTVIIPEGYTYIGDGAFWQATNIRTVYIPASINDFNSIGGEFAECTGLTTVYYAGTKAQWVEAINDFKGRFMDCFSINVKCSDGNIFYNENGEMVEEEDSNIIASGTCGENATYTLDSNGLVTISGTGVMENPRLYDYIDNVKSVVVESGITELGRLALSEYVNLERVELGDTVTTIGEFAFQYTGIKEIILSDSVEVIREEAFTWCESLEYIKMSKNLVTIEPIAFWGCTSLKSIDIPSSVTSIGKDAFIYCEKLTDIYYQGTQEQWNEIEKYEIPDTITIHYAISNSEVVISNSETGIPDKALYDGILKVADADKDGVLTISEAEAITELELIKCGIRDLTGLSYCKNLMALSLGYNNIKDISELSKIENLIILDLSNNQISDISVMADFKSKSDYSLLNLSNNSICNIDALEGFGADILSLENNKIKDINVFSKIRCFQFDLSYNQISDIGVFASFEKDCWYYSIGLSNNSIRNIEALEGLKINALDLSNNNIRDISILDKVTTDFGIDTNGNPIGEKEVYTEEQFDKLLSENAVSDVVIEVNDKITITFGKGTMKEVDGVTSYDFTATTTNDYATSKLPTSVKADEFVLKISYNYSGNLPAKASIEIFVGKEFAGKTLYYSLLKEDGTLTETQKAVVNADGCMIVTQEHCSDWVITTTNPNPTPETPDDGKDNSDNTGSSDNTGNNNSGDTGSSDNNENNSTNTKPAPNTGDSSLMFMYIALGMISALFITYKKIRKA